MSLCAARSSLGSGFQAACLDSELLLSCFLAILGGRILFFLVRSVGFVAWFFVCLFVLCVCPFGFPTLPAFPCSLFLVTRIYQAFRSPIKLLLLLTVRSTASTVIALQSYFSLYVFIFPAQELYFYSFCLPFSLQPFVSFLTHHA